MQNKKTLGIVGGMGPAATVDLFGKVVAQTKASCDQDHIHILIDNDPSVPDRSACIARGSDDAGVSILACARRLAAAGADILMIGCNTAHYFYDMVQAGVDVPILHMPRETAKEIARRGYRAAGILGTSMTIQMGLYNQALEGEGVTPIEPDEQGRERLMDLIYKGVKAGKTDLDLSPVLETMADMKARGAQCFILGCTELPVAFANVDTDFALIDPTNVLARAAVCAAGYEAI